MSLSTIGAKRFFFSTADVKCYKMVHFLFLPPRYSDLVIIRSASWNLRTNLTNSWKAWSTFMRALALHSM